MGTKFELNQNILIKNPSTSRILVEFEYNISQAIAVDDMILVVLKTSEEYKNIRNVYGVDKYGNIAWKIERPIANVPFVNLYFNEDNELFAGNWSGWEYAINPTTGEVL